MNSKKTKGSKMSTEAEVKECLKRIKRMEQTLDKIKRALSDLQSSVDDLS